MKSPGKTRSGPPRFLLWTTVGLLLIAGFRVASRTFTLGTSVLLLAAAGAFLFLLLETVTTVFGCSRDSKNRLRLLLGTTLTLWIGAELFLRFGLHRYETYPERNGWQYVSLFVDDGSDWFRILGERGELTYKKEEFAHSRHINSRGIREREVSLQKAPNEYRIVALGDSFTEGVGTAYETSWVKVLEQQLAARMPGYLVTTVNAGISGSDPFFEYMLLRERLLELRPDLVIVCVNATDVNDTILRGGLERFRPDGTIRYARPAPKWEWAYASSYIVRSVVHDLLGYNWYLIREDQMASAEIAAIDKLRTVLVAFHKLSEAQHFELFVVFHPVSPEEVIDNRYIHQLGRLTAAFKDSESTEIPSTDLLDYYSRNHSMTERNARSFFWPVDGHHNTEGYELMGRAIAESMPDYTRLEAKSNAH